MSDRKAWSYTTGRPARGSRPSTMVRVYERPDKPGRLFLSCAWRKTDAGNPRQEALPLGTVREAAEAVAEKVAGERARAILRDGGGETVRATLGQVLAAYHTSRTANNWSQGHRRDQERFRAFWLAMFGAERPVSSIEAAEVEGATVGQGWSERTEAKALKYLRAAGRYTTRKTKLVDRDPFQAVDLPTVPDPATDGLEYSEEQVRTLCQPTPDVDWRVTLAANIAADTGRRIGAIRQLRAEDVAVQPGAMWLTFRHDSDKRRRGAQVPVSGMTAELILEALAQPKVQAGGWLLPGGRVGGTQYADMPWGGFDATGSSTPIAKLHEAEETLSIERVKGRGYHGIKRAHVTASWELAGGDAAKVGDLTGNTSPGVLRRHYRKAKTSEKVAHMSRVRARFEGAGTDEAVPEAVPPKTGSA